MSRRKREKKTPRKGEQPARKEAHPPRREIPPAIAILLCAALLIVVGMVVYANSFAGTFLFDEVGDILSNVRIREILPLSLTLGGRRPVVDFTLAVNYAMGELDVWGYHLLNVVVHLLAGLTLFGIVRRTLLCGGFSEARQRAAPWLAVTVALLWLVHPLQTQSVDYTIQRCESIMGLFYLLTVYCVVRGAGSPRGLWWYVAAVICCALGMGSKAVMVTAPIVVFLFDRTFISKSFIQTLRRRWLLYVGLFATWGVLLVTGVARGVLNPPTTRTIVRPATVGFGMTDVTPWEYLTTQAGVIPHYLRLSLWPHPLCLDYGWPMAKGIAEIAVPGVVVLALLAGTIWALWRRPWLGFLGAWFFIILAPTSSFVPLKDPIFEHRMYLSLAAVVALVVIVVDAILRSVFSRPASGSPPIRPAVGAVLAAAAVLVLGAVTRDRNTDYHSEVGMWQDVVAKRPQNARAHHNLGTALDNQGRYDEGERAFREALKLKPLDETTHTNLGQNLARQGKLDEALVALRKALEIAPEYAKAHSTLGSVYGLQRKPDEAMKSLRRAVELDPRSARAHYNLANALSDMGLGNEAIEHYEIALRLRPQFPDALVNLGIELQSKGASAEAGAKLEEALRLDPTHQMARWHFGYDLLRRGSIDRAVEVFREGARLRPRDPNEHFHLGQALVRANQLEDALREFEETLRLSPNHAQARQARDAIRGARGD